MKKLSVLLIVITIFGSCSNRPLIYQPTGIVYGQYCALEPANRCKWVRLDSAGKIDIKKWRKKAVIFRNEAVQLEDTAGNMVGAGQFIKTK